MPTHIKPRLFERIVLVEIGRQQSQNAGSRGDELFFWNESDATGIPTCLPRGLFKVPFFSSLSRWDVSLFLALELRQVAHANARLRDMTVKLELELSQGGRCEK